MVSTTSCGVWLRAISTCWQRKKAVPFQDYVKELAWGRLWRLALSIVKLVGAFLWAAAFLAASYYLMRSDAADKKEQLSLVVAVILTAIAGALENLRSWCTDSREYTESIKRTMRQLGFLSSLTNGDPILSAIELYNGQLASQAVERGHNNYWRN